MVYSFLPSCILGCGLNEKTLCRSLRQLVLIWVNGLTYFSSKTHQHISFVGVVAVLKAV